MTDDKKVETTEAPKPAESSAPAETKTASPAAPASQATPAKTDSAPAKTAAPTTSRPSTPRPSTPRPSTPRPSSPRPAGRPTGGRPGGSRPPFRGRPGGRDGGRRGGFFRKKGCRFCKNSDIPIGYKDARALRPFLTEKGKIMPRRITGNCAKHQRVVNMAIKRARNVAILPYTTIAL